MYHILLELPGEPQPNQPLLLEETLDLGRWRVTDSRLGLELGVGYAVRLGAASIERSDVKTTLERIDQ
ncbi:MAG: hypothetical protein GEU78_09645 [Actinobacteria bacterium]|nr:hypothetical protein [Actinomycetota bacterium]